MARARRICKSVDPPCGKPAESGGWCAEHTRSVDLARGSRQARGYGTDHEAIRAALMKKFGADYRRGNVWECWRCEKRMHPFQRLHADHSKIAAAAGGQADCLTHGWCNEGKRLPG